MKLLEVSESRRIPKLAQRAHFTYSICTQVLTRGRAVAARRAHNPEVGGSNPPPATNFMNEDLKPIPAAEAGQFLEDHEEEILLLDVRSPLEFIQEHLEMARNIHVDELPNHLQELPKDKLIVTYCMKGARCSRAAEYLRSQNFKAVHIEGGLEAMKAAGFQHD